MKFARLFDIGDEQLLIYTELGENITTVHNVTDTEIARVDTLVEFKNEDHLESAMKYINAMTYEIAETLIIEMTKYLDN